MLIRLICIVSRKGEISRYEYINWSFCSLWGCERPGMPLHSKYKSSPLSLHSYKYPKRIFYYFFSQTCNNLSIIFYINAQFLPAVTPAFEAEMFEAGRMLNWLKSLNNLATKFELLILRTFLIFWFFIENLI